MSPPGISRDPWKRRYPRLCLRVAVGGFPTRTLRRSVRPCKWLMSRNPVSPVIRGASTRRVGPTASSWRGSYAYVADESSGLQVIDVSNPASPKIKGTVDTPHNASGVTVVGSHAYVADDESGLQIIDVSNPASPAITGSVDTPWGALDVGRGGPYVLRCGR